MPLKLYQSKPEPAGPISKIHSTIAIAAGKGGVGKSTVTVNLALALQSQGYRVGILDTDLYGPSIRKMLPEDRLPGQKGEILYPALCSGIKMMSMAYFRRDHEAVAIRAPIANSLIAQFVKKVEWGELDILLIDFPPGTGDIQITLSQQANLTGAIMVTTPQEVAVMDVRKAMHLFHQVNVPIIGVIENMSYYVCPHTGQTSYLFGKGGGERLAQTTGFPFLGPVPIDSDLCQSGDKGQSLFTIDHEQRNLAVQSFKQIAVQLIAHLEIMQKMSSICLQRFELIWKEL